jgi:hypothetical protein
MFAFFISSDFCYIVALLPVVKQSISYIYFPDNINFAFWFGIVCCGGVCGWENLVTLVVSIVFFRDRSILGWIENSITTQNKTLQCCLA